MKRVLFLGASAAPLSLSCSESKQVPPHDSGSVDRARPSGAARVEGGDTPLDQRIADKTDVFAFRFHHLTRPIAPQ